jgi:1,4-alpha-glucan branching enzyme
MLYKSQGPTDSKLLVTFELPNSIWADGICVVGEFNGWDRTANPMQQERDGLWRLTLELDTGRQYQFRYLLSGREWMNDTAADAYHPNEFGSDNSIVHT